MTNSSSNRRNHPLLPEASRNVVFRFFLRWIPEDHVRAVVLDQLAEQKEAGVLSATRRLLHVVCHDHDGALVLDIDEQILDLRRRQSDRAQPARNASLQT